MARRISIYVPLLDEGTEVSRPVEAEWLGGDRYRIMPTEIPADEVWEFRPGTVVIGKKVKGIVRVIADEGKDEDFWEEHDPYGDRFGTNIPLWSCLISLSLVAIVIIVLWRTIATSIDL